MRLAISNIAWDTSEDAEVAALLQEHGIDAIDIAPGKYFPDVETATDHDVGMVRQRWEERGIEITGMQALLFGTSGLNVFAAKEIQVTMLSRLSAVCRVAERLGARNLVFGSPRNRDRGSLNDAEALEVAVGFFRELGDIAQSRGVTICLEPNPSRYGANFMINSAETALVVEAVRHPAIGMQFDSGAMKINGENPAGEVARCAALVRHAHASEPDLVPIGRGGVDHAEVAEALRRHLPGVVVCLEMVATSAEPHLNAIDGALQVAIQSYRGLPAQAVN